MTSNKEQRQKLIALAKSRRAVGSSTGTEATSEPISASPLSVAPGEGPETRGDKKRKQLVKAPTTVISIEEESSGSPLVQRRRRGFEGAEGDASPIQVSPTRPPSPAPLPSSAPFLPRPQPPNHSPCRLKLLEAGLLARREPLTPRAHHALKPLPPRPRGVMTVPTEPRVPTPRGSLGSSS